MKKRFDILIKWYCILCLSPFTIFSTYKKILQIVKLLKKVLNKEVLRISCRNIDFKK